MELESLGSLNQLTKFDKAAFMRLESINFFPVLLLYKSFNYLMSPVSFVVRSIH